MFILLIGGDATKRAQAKAEFQKQYGAFTHRVSGGEHEVLQSLMMQSDMFGDRYVIYADGLLTKKDHRDELKLWVEVCAQSPHVVLFDELATPKSYLSAFESHAHKVYLAPAAEKPEALSPFGFTQAFVTRDKKRAWRELEEIVLYAAHETHGALWWQIKKEWQKVLRGGASPYSRADLMRIGKEMIRMLNDTYNGEASLAERLQLLVLTECK